jgi:iron complex transport system substrate-binding protein
MKRIWIVLFLFLFALSACAPAATPTATAVPTAIPTTAPTAAPTATVKPTAAATSAATPSDKGNALTDGMGRKVAFTGPAKKIISLAPSNTEVLYAVGAGLQMVGRDEFSDFPEDAKKLTSVGGSMGKYNFEQIASLQPDLVLASPLNTPEQIKSLEDLKLTVYVLPNPTTLDEMFTNLVTVGGLTGHSDVAKDLATGLQTRVKRTVDALAGVKTQPKVFYELDATDPAKPYTAGANTFIDTLIKMVGGVNVGANLKGDYPQISQEVLLTENPDIILLGDAAYGTTVDSIAKRPGWAAINAVKQNKVFTFDDNTVSRPGPRLVDGLETLAKLVHPEAFK